jgi:hypothetical protein
MPAKKTATKPATEPWTCPSCRAAVATPFCSTCGEQPISPRHLTLRHLASQTLTAFSTLDSKVGRTFRALVTQPGALTVAYVEGWRKPYLGPFQVFLASNALFFALQSLSNINVFSSTLSSHLAEQDWAPVAQTLVARHLAAHHTTLAAYAPLFDQAAVLNAKALIILMVLAFSALLPLVFLGNRRPFAAHAVFSLHLYAFLLLLFCVSLGISAADFALGGGGLKNGTVDLVLSLINVAVCVTYLFFAIGRTYGDRGVLRIAKALGLASVVAFLVLGYRFVILLITLATT